MAKATNRGKPKTVNLYQAKTHLSKLVEEASDGAEIIIAKAGTAKARLMPLEETRKDRKPGGWEGRLWIADDFDDELPPETLAGFLGGNDEE
ncbi:MAG TPA: type II toxin-antitoxin system prevent-host-death family antitoxin [Longimicrobiales bacterium]|nr:type II toxin-antitoxin system prevent-host-death family antitoxin [Longimicrobiales bacterium]